MRFAEHACGVLGLNSHPPNCPVFAFQGAPGQRVVVPFLTHFGDLTSW